MTAPTFRQRFLAADHVIAPIVLFVSVYVATFVMLALVGVLAGQWRGLGAVIVASAVSIVLAERGQWELGFFVPPRLALGELAKGAFWGGLLVGFCAVVVALATSLRHVPGPGLPWRELWVVFVPAVIHEELLFRGYPFQKLIQWRPPLTIILIALAFAALHTGNNNVSIIGIINIFLGGVLLGFAYLRYRRLWFPIGLHFAWNLMLGPIAGHEVSGYVPSESLLLTLDDRGPDWLTGGAFGMEASVVMTVVEAAAIALLWRANMIRTRRVSVGAEKGVT